MDTGLKAKLLEKLIEDLHLIPGTLSDAQEGSDKEEKLESPKDEALEDSMGMGDESDDDDKKKGLLSIVIAQGKGKK